jgi:acetolactate synthase-1/2/3 large subunit
MEREPLRTAWAAVVEALAIEEVDLVFGLPGNPLHFVADLAAYPEVRPILVRHEASGAFMAYAYARVTGRPGVCFASPGPGSANLASGLLEAYSGCQPLVALANGTPARTEGMGAFQELDTLALFRPITKWVARPTDPEKVPWVMQRAFALARGGRPGPVFVDLPGDMALREARIEPYRSPGPPVRVRPDPAAVSAAARALADAQRPVIVAGNGCLLSGAGQPLRSLAGLVGAPVLTTPGGRGSIPEDHPLAVGQTGLYFTGPGKAVYDAADLLVTVGSRMEEFQSGAWQLFPAGARFVQIDLDPGAIGQNWRPDVAVVGDARLVLEDLYDAVLRLGIDEPERVARVAEIAEAKARFLEAVERECAEERIPIRTRQAVHAIERVFGPETIICHENGGQDLWSYYWPYHRVLEGGASVPPGEQTVMGLGCVGAIGAKLARPGKQVVCTTGDGAFQMYLGEVATAVQYRAAVTWLILDNASLGWPQYLQMLEGRPTLATEFTHQPDLAAVVRALGAYGERVEDPAEVLPALERARRANAEDLPAAVVVVVERHDYPEWFVTWHREVWGLGAGGERSASG